MRLAIVVAIIGQKFFSVCNDGTGTWSYSISDGVTDFAYGGVAPRPLRFQDSLGRVERLQASDSDDHDEFNGVSFHREVAPDGEDPNAISCVDPVLRADIANAVSKVTSYSCKGIVKAVLFNLNRPGWAVNCVDFTAFNMSGFYQDYNFCDYDAFVGGQLYTIRMALIDTTSS